MDYFSSDVFKISLFLVVFFIFYGLIIYLIKDRIINHTLAQSDEKRLKIYEAFSRVMRIYKILLWISPIFLVSMLLNLFLHRYDSFFFEMSSVVVVFVAFFIAYLYSKMILKAAGNGSEKK